MEPSTMSLGRRAGLLAILAAAILISIPAAANAASVTPTHKPGNPDCVVLDPAFSELKIDELPAEKSYTDGTLTVTISNVTDDQSFDWSSDLGVDAVIVKSSSDALVYSYTPESHGDTLVSGPVGHDISHVSFCYDEGEDPPPPPPPVDVPVDPADPVDPPVTPPGDPEQIVQPLIAELEPEPEQLVLGERIVAGTARMHAPTGCATRAFTARVSGAGIARVVFMIDGKRVATLTKPNRARLFTLRVNPARLAVGVHRLVAKVTFRRASRTRSKTLRSSFQRCARQLQAPRFTG